MPFSYPPLPSSDGLRILTLKPGTFWSRLEGSLESVAFSTKPEYMALSYTWADPDEEHAKIPCMKSEWENPAITINGCLLPLFHNLALALRFLRSASHPLRLWIDAICIDQANVAERNGQVALMAFIFTRAAAVVSWLGVPRTEGEETSVGDKDESGPLYNLWMLGGSQQIAVRAAAANKTGLEELFSFTAGPISEPTAMGGEETDLYDYRPGLRALAEGAHEATRVHDNPYWRRLWVIQEVCLPRNLAFVFGGEVWSEAALRLALAAAERVPGRVMRTRGGAGTMEALLGARRERFGDSMRLEGLVERFMRSGCAETRDRVFGLVGLANDVDSVAMAGRRAVEGGGDGVAGYETGGRGRGVLEIDYTRSFYDIWRDVVSYMYFRAKPLLDFGKTPAEMEDERRVRVVRFAGVVQRAFEGKVEEESRENRKRGPKGQAGEQQIASEPIIEPGNHGTQGQHESRQSVPSSWQRNMIQAKGYIAGTILHIGPAYSSFVGSYREQQRWIGSWDAHYGESRGDLEILRRLEETYSAKIINYTAADLARVRHISNTSAGSWGILDGTPGKKKEFDVWPQQQQQGGESEPVRFLGSNLCMGLAPAGARVGDVVVRFWDCDAAVVVRRGRDYTYGLVGRADVAELSEWRRGKGMDFRAKDAMRVVGGGGGDGKVSKTRGMYVLMDFETLQLVSSAIAI
jgi:hypothetical protein